MGWQEDNEEIAALVSGAEGSRKYRCPRCSHTRRNKIDRPLSITRTGTDVRFFCHHCSWCGGYSNEAKRSSYRMGGKAENQTRDTAGHERWRRRDTVW
jgi:late competence protein required for DNA uptake (superfamily II DNA/RNA helicase)